MKGIKENLLHVVWSNMSEQQHMKASEYRSLMGVGMPEFKDDGGFKKKSVRKNEEDELTMQVVEYLELLQMQGKVVLFSHIPQETYTKSWATKRKNTKMGVRSGVPDMLILFEDKVLFLELKKAVGGVVSDAQDMWIKSLNDVSDDGVVIAKIASGWWSAKKVIDSNI